LVGVLSEPRIPPPLERPWVVLLNAGITPRVGPGRLSVRLARHAARADFQALRFDHGGLGDSPGRWIPGQARGPAVTELGQVLDALVEQFGAQRFVLVGLCSGAATALARAQVDPRVAAIALLNPLRLRSDGEWNAAALNAHHTRSYLTRSLFQADSWRRALSGKIQYRRLAEVLGGALMRKVLPSPHTSALDAELAAEFEGLLVRGTRVLLGLSQGDHAADQLAGVLARLPAAGPLGERLQRCLIPHADHTFSVRANQEPLLKAFEDWLGAQRRLVSTSMRTGSGESGSPGGPSV
jgi:hypothetical protein